jgi:hypothetical protein
MLPLFVFEWLDKDLRHLENTVRITDVGQEVSPFMDSAGPTGRYAP